MLNLIVSMMSETVKVESGTYYRIAGYSVHPDTVDKHDGLLFPTAQSAAEAAIVWVKSAERFGKAAIKANEKEVSQGLKAAERATKKVASRIASAQKRLEAERARYAEKQAALDKWNELGTFQLIGGKSPKPPIESAPAESAPVAPEAHQAPEVVPPAESATETEVETAPPAAPVAGRRRSRKPEAVLA